MAEINVRIGVEPAKEFKGPDLYDLCDATEGAIIDGGGFGWVRPPPRKALEAYYRGVLVVPERTLFLARLDGVVCGSAQLVRPMPNNEAQAFACNLMHSFVAPWARGHGLARELTLAVESYARREGFKVLNLDVRETQTAALALYESLHYVRWGKNPKYALVEGKMITGHYYYKELK
ncbi:MAG: N-acetyltransferase family protein [Alphaproteobacteria bacterium]